MTIENEVARNSEQMGKLTFGGSDDSIDRLIIGLDFGTTYSGLAYVFTADPDKVFDIRQWPGVGHPNAPKAPSTIKYSDSGSFQWGYALDRTTEEKIEGIKLLLDPYQEKPLYVPPSNTEAELKKLGKPAIDVATDYIKAIYKYAMKTIEGKYPKDFLDGLDKRFVLSVPAIWSDRAKDATLKAARHAGIHPVTLIKEPEAAALATLHFLKRKGLEVGDAIVICDAGGGTVDLVSYEIEKLAPLELGELVRPTGGLAGSLMLNKRFEEWVKNIVGERAYLELRETNAYRLAMRDFDQVLKPGFRSREDEDRYVTFPMANLQDDPAKNVKANCITLTGSALHEIFSPVLREIDKLVAEQINLVYLKRVREKHPKDSIKAIFLVGGFGSNVYIREAIAAAHPEIQVIQPDDAWSAIMRGAVLSQLPQEAKVVKNIAPKHYGVSASTIYEPDRDKGQEKFLDTYEDVWRTEIMFWYIKKDDDILRSRKIEFPFYRKFREDVPAENLIVKEILFECSAEREPEHPTAGLVEQNCVMTADLSKVPRELFKTRTSKTGARYIELHYKLMVSVAAKMTFSLQVGGTEISQLDADY